MFNTIINIFNSNYLITVIVIFHNIIYFVLPVAPHIDRKNLQKKVMRIGQMLRLEADIKGEPPPVVTWKRKDVVLKSMDRLKIENEDYHTMFVLNKLQRSDAGTYTVIAKNDSGTDQVDVELQVYKTILDIRIKCMYTH